MDQTRLDWPLTQLTAAFDQYLLERGYASRTRERNRRYAHHLIAFAEGEGQAYPGFEELVAQYPQYLGVADPDAVLPESVRRRITFTRMLAEYRQYGCCQRRRYIAMTPIPARYLSTVEAYLTDLAHQEYRPATIRTRGYIKRFLSYLDAVGLRDWSDLTAQHLADYVAHQAQINSSTMAVTLANLRAFTRFLYLQALHPIDLSATIPRQRYLPTRIPSAWTRDDVEKLLGAVDRGNQVGKRDYAMLLLAARLGMRVSDIRALRLEHLQWETRRMVFTQTKTGREVSLPILPDVGEALIAYLQHGRPPTSAREVFVQHQPPFAPFASTNNLGGIIDAHSRRAGITLPVGKRHGFHALRHTLASLLLAEQTPLTTISEILGHLNVHSTRVYLGIDVTALRQCALDPEEVCHANHDANR